MHAARRWAQSAHRHTSQLTIRRFATRAGQNATIHGSIETPPPATAGRLLAGKTIAVKDNIVTSFAPTTAASKALEGYVSPFDATVVRLIRENGGSIGSKTNLDGFGMGSHSQNSHYGPVHSLFSRDKVPLSPGGSSGGSAIAVTDGSCWAALGTDTGGSVRLPAAYCGVVGFKPSYGLISRWGVIQYANSLDTVGIIANSVRRTRELFDVVNQHDAQDPTSLPPRVRDRLRSRTSVTSARRLRIGIPTTYNIQELSPAVKQTYLTLLERLQDQGHTLKSINLPTTRQALSAYYVLAPAEASSNLAKYDGIRYGFRSDGSDAIPSQQLPLYAKTRGQAFGPEVKRRILLGAYTLSSEAIDNYFIQAQKVRRLVQRDFDHVFAARNILLDNDEGPREGVDIILTPTAPTLPPTVDEVKRQSAVEHYMNDVFTVPASLACLAAISVPVDLPEIVRANMQDDDVRTAGMQVIGQFGDDQLVLQAAESIEEMQKRR